MGPLSCVFSYGDGRHAFVCGQDGWVSLMSVAPIEYEAKAMAPLPGEERLVDWLHPMRRGQLDRLDEKGFATCLKSYYPPDKIDSNSRGAFPFPPIPREGLTVFALLSDIARRFAGSEVDPDLKRGIEDFARREEPQRLAWLLRILLQFVEDPGANEARRRRALDEGLELCWTLWREIERRGGESYICNLAGQILRFLETLKIGGTHCPPSPLLSFQDPKGQLHELLAQINKCLWWDPYPENCPGSFGNQTRRRELQVTQITRTWHRLQGVQPIGRRLACLCECLADLWQPERSSVIGWRLSGVAEAGLPLTADEHRQWQPWMAEVASFLHGDSNPRDDLPQHREAWRRLKVQPPYPLSLLERPELRPLTEQEVGDLADVWGKDERWPGWVERLASLLAAIDRARSALATLRAWYQWELMVELLGHFAETGRSLFTRVNGYTLLEFWWHRLVDAWQKLVERERTHLIEAFKADPDRYILIRQMEDVWLDASRVKLRIDLLNHGPNDLRVVAADSRGFTNTPISELNITAGTEGAVLEIRVDTARPNLVEGELILTCRNLFSGETVECHFPVNLGRSLERFIADRQWQPTWARLVHFLKAGVRPVWIEGKVLEARERERLEKLVRDHFGVKVGRELKRESGISPDCLDQPLLFSPDLALGAEPGRLVEQFHALLHGREEIGFSYLALAVWHLREIQPEFGGRPIPGPVIDALGDRMPEPERVLALLRALFADGDDVTTLEHFLQELGRVPDEAMGAWCRGEPLYWDPSVDLASLSLEERYAAPATLFGSALWRTLDRAGLDDRQLADWLGVDRERALETRRMRVALYRVFDWLSDGKTGKTQPREAKAAEALLEALGAELVQTERNEALYAQISISVLYDKFDRCYLLLPNIGFQRQARFGRSPPGLWLCLGLPEPPTDLPGKSIALTEDHCLALLHTRSPDEARALLNRWAATQHRIVPQRVFRTSDGMGDLVCDHFEGRDDELKRAHQAVMDSDKKPQALLIVGGRRMGKTSFRERLYYDLSGKCGLESEKRLFLDLDLQAFPVDFTMTPANAEYLFFKRISHSLSDTRHAFPLDTLWFSSQKDSEGQRENAREAFREHLDKIKKAMGHVPVLVMDETERFAQVDARHGFQTMLFLRELVYANRICLLATSYPHGAGQRYALQNMEKDSGSPHYNTFTVPRQYMIRWTPEVAWSYLHSKLAGFGITLPLHLRDEVVRISRGIPWLIHLFGRKLCSVDGEMDSRHLIGRPQWQRVREEVLVKVREELKTTIDRRAEEADETTLVRLRRHAKTPLAENHLWDALVKIAGSYELPSRWQSDQDRKSFDKALCTFTVAEVAEVLGGRIESERIAMALNRLTASTVLEGDFQDPERFYFANDLLPMVVREMKELDR